MAQALPAADQVRAVSKTEACAARVTGLPDSQPADRFRRLRAILRKTCECC